MSNILVAYYSKTGKNYVAGNIVELEKGNTEVVAEKIQALTGGDLFHIETVKKYPNDYYETTEVAKNDLDNNERPELVSYPDSIDKYDLIILGYPNWWGTFPVGVMTFLEKYDFSGKKILPFCTHEGSGLGQSEKDLREKFCTNSEIAKGLPIYGHSVQRSDYDIENWLKENRII